MRKQTCQDKLHLLNKRRAGSGAAIHCSGCRVPSFYYLIPHHRLPDAPRVGQHVTIEGQPGIYIVLRLDTKRFAADLMSTFGNHEIEHNVPYFAIEPAHPAPERLKEQTAFEERSGK